MPIIKSAKKAMRQSEKNRVRNYKVRRSVKETMKEFLELAKEKKLDEIKNVLPKAFSVIDKAVKVHVLHKNNAARKKARLSAVLARLEKK